MSGKDRTKESSVDSFLRRVFDRIPVGLYRTTPSGEIVHANLAVARMLGYESVEELMKRNLAKEGYEPSYPRSDFKRWMEEDGMVHGLQSRWQRIDGTYIDVREYADLVRDEKGEPLFYDGAVEDVSEFKKAESTILEREREYQSMFGMFRLLADNMQDMLWAKDLEKRFIFANKAICEKLLNAFDTEEPTGKTDMFFAERERAAHPEDLEWHTFGEICEDSDAIVMGTRKPGQFDEFGNVQGQFMYLDVHKTPLFDESGLMIGTVGSARIVTREKELESERKLSQKALEEAFTSLRSTQESTLRVMAKLVETRDPYIVGHQERVALLAMAIADELGLDDESREGLRVASLVHDVGKLKIPMEILSKPGVLSTVEMDLVRSHPQAGWEIMKEINYPWPVEKIILQHHERMDGSGYPNALFGEKIMREARILAVADVVEAMSSDRPYRPALGIERALDEISKGRGRFYDPEVVDACLRLFREEGFTLTSESGKTI